MVPVLSLVFPYSHLEAIATSITTIVMVASFNTYNFHKRRVIVWRVVPWIAFTSAIFAYLSAALATRLPEKLLILIFLVVLCFLALRTFLITKEPERQNQTDHTKIVSFGIGCLSGIVGGMTGVGGGGISTSLMLVSGLTKNVQATPTANAIMIFTSFFASLSFALSNGISDQFSVIGYIHFDAALFLFMGSVIFSKIGVMINQKFPLFWRKTILGFLLLLICLRLVIMLLK